MPYLIMLVDGDALRRKALAAALKSEFEVVPVGLAREAIAQLKGPRAPDAIVSEYDLPDVDGLSFLQMIREGGLGRETPILMTSAGKSDDAIVAAFERGIDDHLPKPFDPRELIVRVRAVLRRRYERIEHWGSPISSCGIEIDPGQRRCSVRGKLVHLQPREFELLEILMRKAGRVLSRAYLLETVWGMSSGAATRAVDVMVSRLRAKLGSRAGLRIETVSKLGYCFRADGA